jgi:hypothetical protein
MVMHHYHLVLYLHCWLRIDNTCLGSFSLEPLTTANNQKAKKVSRVIGRVDRVLSLNQRCQIAKELRIFAIVRVVFPMKLLPHPIV